MEQLSDIQRLAVWVLPVLFAITVHEVAHGWMARKLGDNTAYMLGRITLNPIKHIDPIGTVIVPLAMFFLGGLVFGWAKPVPVSWKNLKNPRRDMALVAVAGPGANLVMAIIWAVMMRIGFELQEFPWFSTPMLYMGMAGITINAILMILNLMPILPLDGGRILSSFLPPKLEMQFARMEPYGLIILLVLIFTGILGAILGPGIRMVGQIAYAMVGLS